MGNAWMEFVQSQTRSDADAGGGDVAAEYAAICNGVAIVDRSDRALLEVTGADRASWLHNLTTNEVKNLGSGEGNYAFVLNVKGRILFDLNICVRPDSILLDLDGQSLVLARQHFDKYTITEDVVIHDQADGTARFGLTGPAVPALLEEIGAAQVSAMPSLGTKMVTWSGRKFTIIRHDFSGALGVDVIAEPDLAAELWAFLTSPDRSVPAVVVGSDALHIHRIESGLPWTPHEINNDVLPGETGQLERAVSYQKGCYLGQEVVERMRSRGVLARKLCGLVLEGCTIPEHRAELLDADGHVVGATTSACQSISKQAVVALAYVKMRAASAGTKLVVSAAGERVACTVSDLPFVVATPA